MYDSKIRKAMARVAASMDKSINDATNGVDLQIVAKDALFELELGKHVLMQFIREEEENLSKNGMLGRDINYGLKPDPEGK